VLVTERDFEVQDPLPVTLEPEMPRFDDARVHGPDGHLMDFLAFDAEEFHRPRRGRAFAQLLEPDGLQPRMALGRHAPRFGDLPLE
jgi:hypothetical protein